MKPTLEYILEITSQAGDILQTLVGKKLDVQHKSQKDLVTQADHEAEAYLIQAIKAGFPEHAINTEESGVLAGAPEHQWYIDPLDGTLNFAHGVPFYAVSVGYAFQGEMELGVVYDPVRREFFSAQKDRGAALNGVPIQVSDHSELVDCMLATGFPPDMSFDASENLDYFRAFLQRAQTIRRMGSSALDIVYVAAGRLDGYWKTEIYPWDVAAGGLIVREAGGVVTDLYNQPDFMQEPISMVCANPVIHAKMMAVLNEVRGNHQE
jgi:myo-inositol-1(or 4)-monophosphatase